MERDIFTSVELTGQAQSAYSYSGGIYMGDGSSGPGPEGAIAKVPSELGPNRADPAGRPGEVSDEGSSVGVLDRPESSHFGLDGFSKEEIEKMPEWERRSRGLSGDSDFQEIMNDEALKVLKAKDEGRWFEEKFDGKDPGEDGHLVDTEGASTLPLQEIGTEIEDVAKRALERFDAKRAEDGDDDSTEAAPVKERSGDGAPVEGREGSKKPEDESYDPEANMEGVKEERIFQTKLDRYLAHPEIRALLESDIPDFNPKKEGDEGYSEVVNNFIKFIENEVESGYGRGEDRSRLLLFASTISRNVISVKGIDGEFVSYEPKDAPRRVLFERAVEKIISIPDITPQSHYRLDIEAQNELTKILKIAERSFSNEHEFIQEIGTLVEARANLHELRYSLPSGEQYKKFLNELRTNGLQYAYNDMAGVSQALRLYERLNSRKLADIRTWFSAKDISQIDREVEETMIEMWKTGELKKNGRRITRWELDRAINTANTFFNGSQRQAIYEGAGEVNYQGTNRTASTKNEFITRSLYPFKMAAIRYFAGNKPANWLLRRFTDRRLAQEKEKGGATTKSIFGLKDRTLVVDQMGAPDLRSHGWRLPIMHFSGVKITDDKGKKMSLLEFFNENGADITPEKLKDTTFSPPTFKVESNEEVEAAVLGQTLNLSALVGFADLGADLKEKAWQKRAIYNPAAIVAFRPEIIADFSKEQLDMWREMAPKLDIAFSIWADKQFEERYRGGMSMKELRAERDAFKVGVNNADYRHQILNQEYLSNLSEEQQALLRKVIDRGIGEANYLSTAKLPHVYDLDDTVYVAWNTVEGKKEVHSPEFKDGKPENIVRDVIRDSEEGTRGLDDPNMFRLLLNDQANLQEKGWGPLIPMFANITNAKNFEWAKESVAGLAGVIGLAHAQEWNEPMALAVIDMMKAYPRALLLGENRRILGLKMSEYEKLTGERVYLDEEEIGNTLEFLAANSVIPAEGGRSSRLNKLKWAMGGSELHKLKGKARGILQILLLVIPAAIITGVVKEANEGFNETQ